MIEKLFEGCENLGWSVSEDQEAGTVELESYSPAGENLVVTVEKENFVEKVREYAEYFDIDEHIEMWVEARSNGVAGVPKSTRELVEDAEKIKEMCVGGFLGFGLGMMLFALVMRPADEAGRKSDAERIRRLEGELQATSAKYREMANMMAYWRSRCIAYEKMLVERSRKAGAEK